MNTKHEDKAKTFSKGISVSGGLWCYFVFENEEQTKLWIEKELPKLEEEYGKLNVRTFELPCLKVGDQCNVHGDAYDVYTIVGIVKYSENRYGFALDSGFVEEVAKCHTEFLDNSFEDE
jgi:hypothetical protein